MLVFLEVLAHSSSFVMALLLLVGEHVTVGFEGETLLAHAAVFVLHHVVVGNRYLGHLLAVDAGGEPPVSAHVAEEEVLNLMGRDCGVLAHREGGAQFGFGMADQLSDGFRVHLDGAAAVAPVIPQQYLVLEVGAGFDLRVTET